MQQSGVAWNKDGRGARSAGDGEPGGRGQAANKDGDSQGRMAKRASGAKGWGTKGNISLN